MSKSFNNFEFYRTFRLKLEKDDKTFIKIRSLQDGIPAPELINDITLIDLNLNGISFSCPYSFNSEHELEITIFTKKWFNKWELTVTGSIVRSYTSPLDKSIIHYGVKLNHIRNAQGEEDLELKYFLKDLVFGFKANRLKNALVESALAERDITCNDGLELYSLLNSLYQEAVESPINETLISATNMIGASVGRIYKINVENDKLENIVTGHGVNKKSFDFRKGLTGSIFTSGNNVNFDYPTPKKLDEEDTQVKNIIGWPLYNKHHQIIGVLEFINKKGEKRFNYRDEFTARFLSQIFSIYFKEELPHSKTTQVLHLNPTMGEDFLYFGDNSKAKETRDILRKIKTTTENVMIVGEKGLGKKFIAKVIHEHGLMSQFDLIEVDCQDTEDFSKLVDENFERLSLKDKGTVIFSNIDSLGLGTQKKLYEYICQSEKRIFTTLETDIDNLVQRELFFKDLYNILSQTYIHLIPLRNRKTDLRYLANYFLENECKKREIPLMKFSKESLEIIRKHNWPGNISQLERAIKKSILKGHTNPKEPLTIEVHSNTNDTTLAHELSRNADKSISLQSHLQMLKSILKVS